MQNKHPPAPQNEHPPAMQDDRPPALQDEHPPASQDEHAPTLSLKRFLPMAILYSAIAAVAWKYTTQQNGDFTVWVTKSLHQLIGYPAPYMLSDETRFYWHATLFPPLAGLMAASTWISWKQRILRFGVGYITYCGLTAIAITIHDSPYLQQTKFVKTITSSLVNANCLMFGVVIWVLLAGPWYNNPRREIDTHAGKASRMRLFTSVTHGWFTRVLLLWFGVAMIVPLFALTMTPEGRSARSAMAKAMRQVDFFPHPSLPLPGAPKTTFSREEWVKRDLAARDALAAIEHTANSDKSAGLKNPALYYMMGHLFWSMRPEDDALRRRCLAAGQLALKQAKKTRLR